MASYKVIQDVEAEDKLLGPLTLRQFIYAAMAAITLYLSYVVTTHSAGFLLVIFLPFALICGFFAFPWGRDQPTEVWALAKIRFMIKPRRRVWDQSGAKELVTVTAPKQVQVNYTNGLSQTEVQSRLVALANTIDSRGWAIKNANLNVYSQPALVMNDPTSDRLVAPSALPQQVTDVDVKAADDILDEKNNARAQAVNTMIEQSAKAHRAQIIENLKQTAPTPPTPVAPQQPITPQAPQQKQPANYWFLNQPTRAANIPTNMATFNTQVITPGMTEEEASGAPLADEQSLMQTLDAKRQELPTTAYYSHLHTIQPLSAQQPAPVAVATPPVASPQQPQAPVQPTVQWAEPQSLMPADFVPQQPAPLTIAQQPQQPATPPVTPAQQAAILQLSNNNDLDVATLAREADRAAPDEVVIRLH